MPWIVWQQKWKIVDKPFQPISKEEHEVVLKYKINLLNAIVKINKEKQVLMHKWHVGWPIKFLRMLGSNQAIKQEEDEHPHKALK